MGHPVMSTKQILFSLILLIIALALYQYFGGGEIFKYTGFSLKLPQKKTAIESNFVKLPDQASESAIEGAIEIDTVNEDSAILTLNAKSKVSEVVKMVIWTDTNKVADWIDYSTAYSIPKGENAKIVYVKYRDSKDYESITYSLEL